MAVDRVGNTILAGQVILLGGKARHISGSQIAVECDQKDLILAKDTDCLKPLTRRAGAGHTYDLGTGLTTAVVLVDEIDSWQFPIPILRDCRLSQVAVGCMHASGAPPTDWNVEFSKNLSGSADATFTFFLDAGAFNWLVTAGAPTSLDLSAGDSLGMRLAGSSLDGILAQVRLEFESLL